MSIFLLVVLLVFIRVQSFDSSRVEYLKNQKQLEDQVKARFQVAQNEESYNQYRIAYPHPEDFVIHILINPCGANGTHNGLDKTIALGYDCCMERFGRGEYGFHKYDKSYHDGKVMMNNFDIFNRRISASPDEVLHNIIVVDEDGAEIPYEHSRRADDNTAIDESCVGFRNPHTSCIQARLRAVASRYVPSCWDHNYTVDATLRCFTPDGKRKKSCMQVGFSLNAFVSVCNGDYEPSGSKSDRCGTYLEIHRENGSPYDDESAILAETLITTAETKGMVTTTIDLTYKGDKNRLLCAYAETKIRIGTMVRVSNNSPRCCCPPKYHRVTRKGSFLCPIKKGTENGPFADKFDLLSERLERDKAYQQYPKCKSMEENEDMIMCSRDFTSSLNGEMKNLLSGSKELIYSDKCHELSKGINGTLSSPDLDGDYEATCDIGEAFSVCGSLFDGSICKGRDYEFHFHGRLGKVIRLPNDTMPTYGVTFNDGRTVYYFEEHHLTIEQPHSNYEIWYVFRNRFEKVLQKRKGFKVVWPMCTFDAINDRYLPYAQVLNGEILEVVYEV